MSFVAEFQKDIGMAIPGIVECLGDNRYQVSLAVIEVLSRLAKLGLSQLVALFFVVLIFV